ncbi:hypothetical protein Salat_2926900 [Sesamum alatum]|uniref:Uncharacterized protein n=1 Tax=Sesamum alatum TaxID=300844 RepID=A0AAE1XJX0_9LAMI|nr:hypothetical protein Salat_2926900 [Sesamum alatum]
MDEGSGRSADIEEWMKELLPDDVGANMCRMGRGGVTLMASSVISSNQQHNASNLGENYQVAAMNTNINPGMWQHSQSANSDSHNSSVRQSMPGSFPTLFEEFSQTQTSTNTLPNFRQQQLLQKQVVERPNVYQLPMQSNTYQSNIRQHQPTQQQMPVGCQSASPMMMKHQESFNVRQHADQTSLQKSLETQSGLGSERAHLKFQMSAFHQQSQNLTLVDQFKPGNQPQTMHLGPSQGIFAAS